jgi:N-methylhydantoinase A
MEGVLVPHNPGVFSAHGLLVADVRVDESHSYRQDTLDLDALNEQYDELVGKVTERFVDQGFDVDDVTVEREADLRYRGQSYELTVPVPGHATDRIDASTFEAATDRFHERHRRMYGHARTDEPVEVVILRVSGTVPSPGHDPAVERGDGNPRQGTREVHFAATETVETAVYDRTLLAPDSAIEGPAILEEPSSTTVVPPGHTARVSERGNVLITE